MEFGVLSLGDHRPDPVTGTRVPQGERLRSVVDTGVLAEELGFGTIAIGEHHFNDYIVSSPLMMLAAIAARTRRIRLTTAVTLLPILDPVRVAEDFATLDQLSGGRAELTLGRGISTDGYAEFGADDLDSRRLLADKLELLRVLLGDDQPVTRETAFRPPLTGITVQPRPVRGAPRIWMGTGTSEESVRWAAALGMPLMLPSIFRRAEVWRDMVALYRELMAASGKADRAVVGACSYIHVARDSRTARERWRPYLTGYVDWANGLRGVTATAEYEKLIDGPALCGSPAEVTERMQSLDEALSPDIHLSVFDIGGLPHRAVADTMEIFAGEVIPRIRTGNVPVPV
jgi:alkanesulfonate monooxygenase SsuD/methylene tetrahydromethanopterin reductase-like flavin-dependent oxidoreductase (luciferase family)